MKRSIVPTTDVQLIKSILEEDYSKVTYDGCPSFEDFIPDIENSAWFILKYKGRDSGLIKLESFNLTTWIPHIVIKKEFRGTGSEEWGKLVVRYVKERIKDVNFLVVTPYQSAKKYAERVGFNLIGIMPKSIKKNGELMDQYILSGDCLK